MICVVEERLGVEEKKSQTLGRREICEVLYFSGSKQRNARVHGCGTRWSRLKAAYSPNRAARTAVFEAVKGVRRLARYRALLAPSVRSTIRTYNTLAGGSDR